MKIIWLVVVGSLTFSACVSKEKQKAVAKRRYCPNAYLLFAASDSVTKISTEGDSSSIKFGEALQDSLQSELCDTLVNFGIRLSPQFTVSAWVEKDCDIIRCFPMGPKVRLLPTPTMWFINRERIVKDSLKWEVFKELSAETTQYDQLRTELRWDTLFSNGGLTTLIHQVLEGYLLAYEQLAQKHFHQSFCELTPEQLVQLKRELPFALFIAIHQRPTIETDFSDIEDEEVLPEVELEVEWKQ